MRYVSGGRGWQAHGVLPADLALALPPVGSSLHVKMNTLRVTALAVLAVGRGHMRVTHACLTVGAMALNCPGRCSLAQIPQRAAPSSPHASIPARSMPYACISARCACHHAPRPPAHLVRSMSSVSAAHSPFLRSSAALALLLLAPLLSRLPTSSLKRSSAVRGWGRQRLGAGVACKDCKPEAAQGLTNPPAGHAASAPIRRSGPPQQAHL